MSGIRRYDPAAADDTDLHMAPADDGEWIAYDDHMATMASVQELFEDWLARGPRTYSALAEAEERAESLGIEWRHAEELTELWQDLLDD